MPKKINIDDILSSTDISKLSRGQLAQLVSRLSKVANQRLRNLEKSEIGKFSPAYTSIKQKRGNFTASRKNINQLRNEFKQIKNFLGKKTSTIGGFNKLRKQVIKRLGSDFKSVEQEKEYWDTYRRLMEANPTQAYDSTNIQYMLKEEMDNNTQNLYERMQDLIDKEYEESQEDDDIFSISNDL